MAEWVPTYATDIRRGDKIRTARQRDGRVVVDRDFPDGVSLRTITVRYGGDKTERLHKLDQVEIWDVDGSVAERVQVISQGGRR